MEDSGPSSYKISPGKGNVLSGEAHSGQAISRMSGVFTNAGWNVTSRGSSTSSTAAVRSATQYLPWVALIIGAAMVAKWLRK